MSWVRKRSRLGPVNYHKRGAKKAEGSKQATKIASKLELGQETQQAGPGELP